MTINEIQYRLDKLDFAERINIIDESDLHIGHKNYDKGHYCVEIYNLSDPSINRVILHKLIYDKLSDLMNTKIHALRIKIIG
jgi:BolA protein